MKLTVKQLKTMITNEAKQMKQTTRTRNKKYPTKKDALEALVNDYVTYHVARALNLEDSYLGNDSAKALKEYPELVSWIQQNSDKVEQLIVKWFQNLSADLNHDDFSTWVEDAAVNI